MRPDLLFLKPIDFGRLLLSVEAFGKHPDGPPGDLTTSVDEINPTLPEPIVISAHGSNAPGL
jgi:hypothetical protein